MNPIFKSTFALLAFFTFAPLWAQETSAPEVSDEEASGLSSRLEAATQAARKNIPETEAERQVREYTEQAATVAPETVEASESLETRLKKMLQPLDAYSSDSDEAVVAERANLRWELQADVRFESMYEQFISPEQKKIYSYINFYQRYGRAVVYNHIEPNEIACEKDVCLIKIKVFYNVPKLDQELSTYIYEQWFKEGDNWYFYINE